MKNFNELFEDAKNTGDHRSIIFNQLIEKVKNEILPETSKAVLALGYKSTYVKTYDKVLASYQEEQSGNPDEEFPRYYVIIDCEENKIMAAKTQWDGRDGIEVVRDDSTYEFSEVQFLKSGIVEFTENLNTSLSKLIEKRNLQNQRAENLLKG